MLETIAPIALGVGAMALTGGAAAPAVAGAGGAGAAGATGAGALGGAFGSADMIAAGAGGGLLGGAGAGAGAAGAASAAPGSIESAGLLDMGGGNMINPEYFVGESMGMPMYAGSPDAPFAERAGNVLSSFSDKMGGNPMKAMQMMPNGGQPQQQVARPAAVQRPQMQPATNVPSLYNQTISGGLQLTDEQKRMLMQRMGGQNGLIG